MEISFCEETGIVYEEKENLLKVINEILEKYRDRIREVLGFIRLDESFEIATNVETRILYNQFGRKFVNYVKLVIMVDNMLYEKTREKPDVFVGYWSMEGFRPICRVEGI